MSDRAREAGGADGGASAAGLEGVADALGAFLRQVESLASRQSERSSPDGALRAVVGCSVRVGLNGARVQTFGHVPRDGAEPATADAPLAREPLSEVFEEPGQLRVVAELPGVAPEALSLRVEGRELTLEAEGAPAWRARIALPADVRADGLAHTLRNGILEATLPLADGGAHR